MKQTRKLVVSFSNGQAVSFPNSFSFSSYSPTTTALKRSSVKKLRIRSIHSSLDTVASIHDIAILVAWKRNLQSC